MFRRFLTVAALGLVAVLALSACSGASAGGNGGDGGEVATLDESAGPDSSGGPGGGAGSSAAASVDAQEALLAFATCMREHGVDMPDPQFEANGDGRVQFGVRIGGAAVEGGEDGDGGPAAAEVPDQETLEAAHEACQEHLEGVVGPDGPRAELSPEEQEQFLAFAKCMREHDVDMPDPQFGSGGAVMIGRPAASGDPVKMPDQETLEAAQEACQELLPGGGEGGGPALRVSGGEGGPSTQSSTDEAAE